MDGKDKKIYIIAYKLDDWALAVSIEDVPGFIRLDYIEGLRIARALMDLVDNKTHTLENRAGRSGLIWKWHLIIKNVQISQYSQLANTLLELSDFCLTQNKISMKATMDSFVVNKEV